MRTSVWGHTYLQITAVLNSVDGDFDATGRASQRLQEMARLPSSTIHRLLQYKSAGARREDGNEDEVDLEGSYTFHATNPLPIEALLVDEAAMLDVKLASALLQALPPACQLVLVGRRLLRLRKPPNRGRCRLLPTVYLPIQTNLAKCLINKGRFRSVRPGSRDLRSTMCA